MIAIKQCDVNIELSVKLILGKLSIYKFSVDYRGTLKEGAFLFRLVPFVKKKKVTIKQKI